MNIFSTNNAIEIINHSKYGSVEYISSATQAELNDIHRLLTDAFRCYLDKSSPLATKKSLSELNKSVTHFINNYR